MINLQIFQAMQMLGEIVSKRLTLKPSLQVLLNMLANF